MAVKFLNDTGLGYFWGKIKAWCNSTFAAIAHTHTSYAVKHSYTTAANAAKNWFRIANANTSQTDTTNPIHAEFILTSYNTSYNSSYYERWFINVDVFGNTAHIVVLGSGSLPFSQARVLYENTLADLDTNDRPAIDIYLNTTLANGTTKIEIEEVYNSGWTFLTDGQLAVSTVPTGFESVACSVRSNGVERSTYSDYATYFNKPRRDITANTTLADNSTYRSTTLNCTGTITITVPSINSNYAWFFIKNFNATSGVITVHPSTTSVLIDGSNADIKLQPGEYIVIHSRAANSYSIIGDGRRYDRCIVSVSNTNNYPFHRIAYVPIITGSWIDRGITFLVSKDFQGGGYGIVRIIFRTNNSASQEAQCSVQWLSRTSDIAANAIQVGFVKTAGASYLDVFYHSGGTYHSAICRVLTHSNLRNGVGRGFTVVNTSTEVSSTTATDPKTSVESYKTIADAGTALHNQAYTNIIAASDDGVVGNAATASAVAWSGITDKPTTIAGYGITDAKIANGTITLGSNSITPLTSHQSLSAYAPLASPALTGTPTAPTPSTSDNSTKIATTAYVNNYVGTFIAAQDEVLTLSSNVASGNRVTLPSGMTYRVGTNALQVSYNGTVCHIGQQFTEYGTSGELSTQITVLQNLSVGDKLGFRIQGVSNLSGTSVATSLPWASITSKPTTLAGYSITDAKIVNGTITLGSDSITPLTSHQTLPTLSKIDSGSGNAVTGISVNNHTITVTKDSTFLTSHQSLSDLGIGNVKNYDQSKAIKSITRNGTTFTYTCLDDTTDTFTQQDNNTTYTFATGDSDGQIKVTPSGGSAQNVSVKGLKSAAYTESSAYAASSHGTHVTFPSSGTPANIGTASNGTASTVARSDHVHALPDSGVTAGRYTSVNVDAKGRVTAGNVKHSYTTAVSAAKNWYRIANASTHQINTDTPLHLQFFVRAQASVTGVAYWESWFVDLEVWGANCGLRVFGAGTAPFSQIRVLYENTAASVTTSTAPAVDLYLNYVLTGGTIIEIEEVYNSGWAFVANGALSASTVPSGYENRAMGPYANGITYCSTADYAGYSKINYSNISANTTLAVNDTYAKRVLNCTGTITLTVPTGNANTAWFWIKNNGSGVITLHPASTAVYFDNVSADITLQAGEFILLACQSSGHYSIVNDGRWISQKANVSHVHGSITNDGKLGTASRAVVTDGSKVISVSSITSTELGYLSGVTSAIQTQLNGKLSTSGNAVSASALQTARTISISGAATGLVSFDGSADVDIEVIRRSCVNRNTSSSPTTAPWYKLASYTGTGTGNANITFLIENIYSGEAIALGHIDVRFYSGAVPAQSNVKFAWFFGQGTDVKVVVPDGDTRDTVEIWKKIGTQYGAYRFTVLSEGNHNNSSNLWTLFSADSAGQAASVPVGWDISPAYYTPVDISHDQTVSGKKTFTSPILSDVASSNWSMQATDKTHYIMLVGGNSNNGQVGAQAILYGSDHSTSPGNFKLHAGKTNATKDLIGMPDGTLTWNGQTIQTSSDERIKTLLAVVPNVVLDAWGDVQWGQFQFLDAVERKGNAARLHLGLVAQRVKAVFETHGLDACAYGILCHEEHEVAEDSLASDLWMVRYEEALAMEAVFQRRRAKKAEARIKALEDRMEALEAKLS